MCCVHAVQVPDNERPPQQAGGRSISRNCELLQQILLIYYALSENCGSPLAQNNPQRQEKGKNENDCLSLNMAYSVHHYSLLVPFHFLLNNIWFRLHSVLSMLFQLVPQLLLAPWSRQEIPLRHILFQNPSVHDPPRRWLPSADANQFRQKKLAYRYVNSVLGCPMHAVRWNCVHYIKNQNSKEGRTFFYHFSLLYEDL